MSTSRNTSRWSEPRATDLGATLGFERKPGFAIDVWIEVGVDFDCFVSERRRCNRGIESMWVSEGQPQFSSWDFAYAMNMGIACLISYWVTTLSLVGFVGAPSELLGGMWAVVATVFVFRDTRSNALSAGLSRLVATLASFALCQAYLLIFPFTAVGMAVLLAIGTIAMMLLGRRGDIVTTGITTAVVMVVAAMSPEDAWQQPLLRLADTVIGIAVGISCKWAASFLFFRLVGEPEP